MTDDPRSLEALADRMYAARERLTELADTLDPNDRTRVFGKAQGVGLALSYVQELIRDQPPAAGRHCPADGRTPAPELCDRLGKLIGWQALGGPVQLVAVSHDEFAALMLGMQSP